MRLVRDGFKTIFRRMERTVRVRVVHLPAELFGTIIVSYAAPIPLDHARTVAVVLGVFKRSRRTRPAL